MATVPSVEQLLLSAHRALELSSIKGKRFLDGELSFDHHYDQAVALVDQCIEALGVPQTAENELRTVVASLINGWDATAKKVWTHKASPQFVYWNMAAHVYIPELAKELAIWNWYSRFDSGMPGGNFWFIPTDSLGSTPADAQTIEFPVPKVLRWLRQLIGGANQPISLENLAQKIHADQPDEDQDNILRSLNNWQSGKALPSSSKLGLWFNSIADWHCAGCFELSDGGVPIAEVLAFLTRNNLSLEQLRLQIPLSANSIEKALASGADIQLQNSLVEVLLVRYRKPTEDIVKIRFTLARATQSAYLGFGRFLLADDFSPNDGTLRTNKLVQLIYIFSTVYNATSAAIGKVGAASSPGHLDDNVNSELRLILKPYLDMSMPWAISVARKTLGKHDDTVCDFLNSVFRRARGKILPDVFVYDKFSLKKFTQCQKKWLTEFDDKEKIVAMHRIEKGLVTSNQLDELNDFQAAVFIANSPDVTRTVAEAAFRRATSLAKSTIQRAELLLTALQLELGDQHRSSRGPEAEERVEHWLSEWRSGAASGYYTAHFLLFEARHNLSKNKFTEAIQCCDDALAACTETSYGQIQGEAARDKLAILLQFPPSGFYLSNYKKLQRHLLSPELYEHMPQGTPPTFEEVAIEMHDVFWEGIYCPYPGYSRKEKPIKSGDAKIFVGEALEVMLSGKRKETKAFLASNKHKFGFGRLNSGKADTALMLIIKLLINIKNEPNGLVVLSEQRRALRGLIGDMAKAWRTLVNIPDFKRQTPIMLAASNGEWQLVSVLLKVGADPKVDDYRGRTALHAAVQAGCLPCAEVILKKYSRLVHSQTCVGNTPLHMAAAYCANSAMVRLLLKYDEGRSSLNCTNDMGMTAADFFKHRIAAPDSFYDFDRGEVMNLCQLDKSVVLEMTDLLN